MDAGMGWWGIMVHAEMGTVLSQSSDLGLGPFYVNIEDAALRAPCPVCLAAMLSPQFEQQWPLCPGTQLGSAEPLP